MILKICPYCRTENPENAVFCKRCGALFRGEPETRDTAKEKSIRKNRMITAVCAVLFVVALGVIMFGSSDEPDVQPPAASATDSTTSTTAQSTTLEAVTAPSANATTAVPSTTAPSTTAPSTTIATTAAPTTTAAPVLSNEEICREYNELVGALEGSTGSITVHKTEKINLEITSFSLPAPMSAINAFMARLIPETDETHSFSNGVSSSDSKVTLSAYIPPSVKAMPDVTAEDVLSAEKGADGSITLKFKPDSSSYTDGQTVFPSYVDSATEVLDFATFALGPVKIIKADIQYTGAEIKAEKGADGKINRLTVYQPVTVMSTGGVGSMTADVGMNLKATTTYEISY